jgi:hypothetical protein
MTKKRRRSLRIFSAHITRNAIEIEARISFYEYEICTPYG